jgi:hypothetical protein
MAAAISIPTKIDCFASLAMTRFLQGILISDLPLKKGSVWVELEETQKLIHLCPNRLIGD